MAKLNIVRIIDVYGWAYDFVGREQNKYSRHNIVNQRWDQVDIRGAHIVYMCGPNVNNNLSIELPKACRSMGIKFIAAYSGPLRMPYSGADAIVSISPQNHAFVNKSCPPQIPKILIPEGIDDEFFAPSNEDHQRFRIGWSGRIHDVKRPHLLKVLKYPVTIKSDWGTEYFTRNRSLDNMRDWYHDIDCLVLTSESECCPRVVLEAMASGLPVVSTDVGFVKGMIGPDWVVPVNPEETVVKEMNHRLDALMNKGTRKRVSNDNLNKIRNSFSWRKLQPLWDDMYEAVYSNNIQLLQRINNIFVRSINT